MEILRHGSVGSRVKAWQAFLADQDFSPGAVDGIFGSLTVQATIAFQSAQGLDPDGEVGPQTIAAANALGFGDSQAVQAFDATSEKNIKTLLPKAQVLAREFLQAVLDAGIPARIISGTRTYEEQNALYAQGRTKPGIKVTNARAGYSNHNFGIAWDIGIFENGQYVEESPLYDKAGQIGKGLGLEWGGDWVSITDKPHFQIKTGLTLAQLRDRVRRGVAIL